jgi:acetylornithine deacetylase/succinyl-diaminopimelate desuccinylase-like protein
VDDRPDAGHNATVLLGFLAQHLAARLDGSVPGTRVCVAGLHTGRTHNRVHGTGTLLMNLSYRRTADGDRLKTEVTRHVADGLRRFTERFALTREFARTARDAERITRLGWDKQGLPALDDADPWAEELLARAGARPAAGDPGFTCDAIWAAGLDDAFTTVLGPGCLAANHAHAPGEFVDLADLEEFAGVVRRLVTLFAEAVPAASTQRPP